jgi:biotin-dependent carboxylase-like uncharacterized protein
MIEILRTGPLTTVQDLGRPGLAALGVGASGAADRGSLKLANRLVGNQEGAAALELTFGGLHARFGELTTVALTGAPCPVTLDSGTGSAGATVPVGMNAPVKVRPGQRLIIGVPRQGLRTYLAFRGGIAVQEVLGSRSTDLLSGIGPAPLKRGDQLPLGREVGGFPSVSEVPAPGYDPDPVLDLLPGPRDDWFTADALASLCGSPYQVTTESNRVGIRLSGPGLTRSIPGELPSEGVVTGSLQVPPGGQPILFLADHPVTGGYPVIAVVAAAGIDRAAQLRPGEYVRFRLDPRASRLELSRRLFNDSPKLS